MIELLNRQVLFVGGKGGVGKTTTAAALAVTAAHQGKQCLLVSTDPAHSLGDLFNQKIGDQETELIDGLRAIEIDPDAAADHHIATVKANMRDFVRPSLYSAIDRQMDLARLAPGATESAMLERLTEIMIQTSDLQSLTIVDTAPTGHTLRLLSLPEVLESWTQGLLTHNERSDKFARTAESLGADPGRQDSDELSYLTDPPPSNENRNRRIREILQKRIQKFRRARKILMDSKKSGFVLVLTPEKLPILESQKALNSLIKHNIQVEAIVINRLLPDNVSGDFMRCRKQQERKHMEEIEDNFGSINRYCIPFLQHDVHGIETLRTIGKHLTDGP